MFRTSIATAQDSNAANVSRKHKFDDDAGSAIVLLALTLDPETQPNLNVAPSKLQAETNFDRKYSEEFLDAVRRCSVTLVELMVKHVDINARDSHDGRTALSIAAELGEIRIIELLLSHGASVNIRDYSLNSRYSNAGPDGVDQVASMAGGRLPLHWAVIKRRSTVVELLLKHEANPNARNSAGRPVLQEACMVNDKQSVKLLLQYGADVDARSYNHVCCSAFSFVISRRY
jgi:ankyrin repeat protein